MDTINVHLELVAALERYPKTRRNKKGLVFCCPRHEDKNPSAWLGEHRWGCHACDFEERLDTLYAELGIDPPKYGFTIEDYAQLKGFSLEKLKKWGVETGRTMKFDNDLVVIPYRDADGKLLRRKFRKATGTFWDPDQDKGHTYLYGLDMLAKASNMPVVLVAGESDCHAAWHHGRLAVGVPGANMWRPQWAQFFKERTVYIWQEPGKAGEKFAETISHDLPDAKVIRANGCKDLADLHKEAGKNFGAELDRLTADAQPPDYTAPTKEGKSGADELLEDRNELVDARCTDVGNARRFIAQHGTEVRYCHTWRKWLEWDGTRWAIDDTGAIARRAKATLNALFRAAAGLDDDDERQRLIKHAMASERGARVDAMLRLAESDEQVAITAAVFDTDPWKLNILNGTLDLRTGELLPHDPKQMHSKLAPVSYSETAECPRFLAFLKEILPDIEVHDFAQRAVGYCLTGNTRERCLFILHGTGANGKSTLIEVIRSMLGDYARQADVSTFMLGRTDSGPRPEVVRLAGVRFVSSIEVEENRRLAESLVKALTGNDTIAARGLYSDIMEFQPAFKLWLGTNHKPTIRGTDNAIWDRIRLIPFTVTISPERRDGDLATKLAAELPGILAWALEGCLAWQQHGLAAPKAVRVATKGYREEMDVVRRFLTDRCVEGTTEIVTAKDLYTAYKKWAEDGGERPMTQTRFGTRMSELGYQGELEGTTRRKMYVGIRLENTP